MVSSIFQNRFLHLAIGVIAALLVFWLVPHEIHPKAPLMAAIVILMAVWWVLEVIPIPVTSILPILLFPLFGISSVADVGVFYGRPIIFLFLGGFMLALGLQESGVHKRIALKLIGIIGSSPKRLILGFMVSAGFLSMWISNTASVMVMLPIGLSIMESVRQEMTDERLFRNFGICFMLGIAYAADMGGMATLVGTPPNLIFLEMYGQLFPDAPVIGFLDWMIIGLPLSLIFMASGWFILTHFIFKMPSENLFKKGVGINAQLNDLGKMNRDEKASGLIFLMAALLWMTGSDIRLTDTAVIHGWRHLLGMEMVNDSAVAVGASMLLFIVPSQKRKGALLTWEKAKTVPWGILLLFGGGFAIAGGFKSSGLSELTANLFAEMPPMAPLAVVALVCVCVTFLTELTSNSAITSLLLPILATGAVVLDVDPKLLMIPATLSASCAFMTPIASPTQAIVFGSGYMTIKEMMRTGIWFNLLGVVLMMIFFTIIHLFIW